MKTTLVYLSLNPLFSTYYFQFTDSMKHIVLFGAGKSATVLIDYLRDTATEKNWRVTIVDRELTHWQSIFEGHPLVKPVQLSIEQATERKALIERADVVISLLPASLHYLVALDCLVLSKHLFTASYIDERIREMAAEIKQKGILFLCEMGLDPGIDHMSAMQLVHRIKAEGGQITAFLSHCGGLVAPESDNNPWHYKISWNPGNVVAAGKAGAVYRKQGVETSKNYAELFRDCNEVSVEGIGKLAYYPNRDSLSYLPVYGMEATHTFIRTTLRHPDFCRGWQRVIELGLTDTNKEINTDGLTVAAFLQMHFQQRNISLDEPGSLMRILFDFLGLADETHINKGKLSIAQTLQHILEQKWKLESHDRDMVVMQHEIAYTLKTQNIICKSALVVKGMNQLHTAMAKTVGLPLGIAARLLLEGMIQETGLHIPIIPGIYEPVLEKLAENGIRFRESKEVTDC